MDLKVLISKIATDKENKKLGKIVRIELLSGKTIKKDIPYAMIRFLRLFRTDNIIPIEVKKLLNYDSRFAWFDITKKEFEEEAKRLAVSSRIWTVKDYSGYIKTQKERKK